MTLDQIIQCCYVVGLTASLSAIAYAMYRCSKALELKAMPVPAPGLPPISPEKMAENAERLAKMLRERAEVQKAQKDQRQGQPSDDLMRPRRHVIKQ